MGTINYGTSEYITIGLEPYNTDDYIFEDGNVDYDAMSIDYDCDISNVQFIMDKYNFSFFDINIKYGYYEGFYLDINANFDFYNWQDKKDALKEATQLKNMLIECCGVGLCEVHPGWCTAYMPHKESINGIKAAVWHIKEDIKRTETFLQEQRKAR